MPKSNEPIKLVYPIGSTNNNNPNQQQQQHIYTTSQNQNCIVTMNNQSGGGNRVTFTSQSLPNGTINITSQPQIMHTVSGAAGIPTATTIKTITAGQHQQNQQQQQQQLGQTTQTLGNQGNLVGTPTMLPAGVVMGMRANPPNQNQQKGTGPMSRVVIGGPHMVGTRPNSPAITLSTLQSGQSGPALILKTENGYQLLRVGPAASGPVGQNINATTGNQTIRLQTVPASMSSTAPTSIVVNSVTTSNASQMMASSQSNTIQPHHVHPSTIASVAPITSVVQQRQPQHHQQVQQHQQQIQHHVQQTMQSNQHHQQQQHQIVSQHQQNTVTINNATQIQQQQNSAAAVQKNSMQGNTKEKCRKFLANLIELSTREPKPVEENVRTLIQELIDANVEPEEFCDRLERLLNASPQPCLIGFLKKSLPLLRQSLYNKELVIEGIKPPPQHVVGIIGTASGLPHQLPRIQAQIRPIGQTTTIGQTQVRMVSHSSTGPRPIGQTTITKQTLGGVRIQGPLSTASGQRIINTQIRPIGHTTIMENNNIQQQQQHHQLPPPALHSVNRNQTFTPAPSIVTLKTAGIARAPGAVQIRSSTPNRAKNTTGITQVKVGQTQIKPISAVQQSNANSMSSIISTISSVATNSTGSSSVILNNNNINNNSNSTLTNSNNNIINNNNNNSSTQFLLNTTNNISTTTTVTPPIQKNLTIKAQNTALTSTSTISSTKAPSKKKQLQDEKAATTATSFFQQPSMSTASSMYGDDDINDVAAMGGVNLAEESQRILGSTENIGTQIRSCKDEVFLHLPALQNRIRTIVAENGLDDPNSEVAVLISHACQERLKNIVEKLAVIAEHRIDILKVDSRYEITKDVRGQIKFLEELDKAEQKRHEEQEREMLLRAAKSRSKIEDPEQLKLKAKAKEMQRAEMEELRQRDANLTALQAIGPRKKPKLDGDCVSSASPSGTPGTGTTGISSAPLRPRIKRVNLRDMLFFMEQERETCRSRMLYKAYLK